MVIFLWLFLVSTLPKNVSAKWLRCQIYLLLHLYQWHFSPFCVFTFSFISRCPVGSLEVSKLITVTFVSTGWGRSAEGMKNWDMKRRKKDFDIGTLHLEHSASKITLCQDSRVSSSGSWATTSIPIFHLMALGVMQILSPRSRIGKGVCVSSGCLQRQELIFSLFRRCKVQDQSARMVGFWWRLSLWFADANLLLCLGEREWEREQEQEQGEERRERTGRRSLSLPLIRLQSYQIRALP